MSIEIKQVTTKKELREYVKFNLELYKNHPYAVPELISEEMETLDKDKNPAFEVCEAISFLACRDGKTVGRITGMINHPSNEAWKEKQARFGFVDFIDDDEVVNALFGAVEDWAKAKGMNSLHGPLGFTDMDNEGMLVYGFDQLSTMATIYNYPYYPEQLERIGFVKDQDWQEFKIYIPDGVPEKHLRIGELVKKKYGLKILKFKHTREIMPYAQSIFDTLNVAFAPLYGFAPLTRKQIDYYVNKYIPLLRCELITVIIREEDNTVAGFGISLPNMSKAMQKTHGKMFPFGWYHLLKTLYTKPKVIDLYLTGVLPEYRNKGVNALLFNDLIPIYKQLGVVYAESNPELETNNAVQAQWDYFKREHHKTRRAYIKQLEVES